MTTTKRCPVCDNYMRYEPYFYTSGGAWLCVVCLCVQSPHPTTISTNIKSVENPKIIASDSIKSVKIDTKSAQQMFEELGYELHLSPVVIYLGESNNVEFDYDTKSYLCSFQYGESGYISIELHKAINQQMIEFGWIK